jgi:hypothetical protein
MVDKYVDHIPFYRQHKQFERLGIKIPEPTILGWFQQVSDLLMPLHFRLWELMNKTNYLQCDETTLPVMRNEKAIMYTYKRFNKLSRYHLDGAYNIDNNGIENAVRPVAVGRKNYLFCQNDDTAESTAIIYSFMGCCKAAGVDFRTWMIYFLDHVHDYDEDYTMDIADLLPDKLKMKGLL